MVLSLVAVVSVGAVVCRLLVLLLSLRLTLSGAVIIWIAVFVLISLFPSLMELILSSFVGLGFDGSRLVVLMMFFFLDSLHGFTAVLYNVTTSCSGGFLRRFGNGISCVSDFLRHRFYIVFQGNQLLSFKVRVSV